MKYRCVEMVLKDDGVINIPDNAEHVTLFKEGKFGYTQSISFLLPIVED